MGDRVVQRRWLGLLGAFLVASVIYNLALSSGYLGADNFANLFELSVEKIIVVVAMTFVIVAGEIDLSVASVMVLAASVVASLHEQETVPFTVAVLIALVVSAAVGYVQGWIVTRLGLPSLVVTLAGLIAWRGVARVLVEDRSIGGFPDWFTGVGQNDVIGPVRPAVLFFVALLVAGAVVLHRSQLGRYLYVVGDNAEVARYSGVDVQRVRTSLFVMSAFVSGLAGTLFAARLGGARGDMAFGYELEIITIVLLGGVSIFGGSGRLSGVTLAILIVLNVRNGLGLANVDGSTQTGVIGIILIASMVGQNLLGRLEARSSSGAPSPVAETAAVTEAAAEAAST